MQITTIKGSAVVGLILFICMGQTGMARSATPRACEFPGPDSIGPVVVADFTDGVSSDGRGPYVKGKDGVVDSRAGTEGALTFYWRDTLENPRALTVNLNKPVPGGGGVPLGIATSGDGSGLITQRGMVGDTVQNLTDIAVGRTDTAAMMSIAFHVKWTDTSPPSRPASERPLHGRDESRARQGHIIWNHRPGEPDEVGDGSSSGERRAAVRRWRQLGARGGQGPLLRSPSLRDRSLSGISGRRLL